MGLAAMRGRYVLVGIIWGQNKQPLYIQRQWQQNRGTIVNPASATAYVVPVVSVTAVPELAPCPWPVLTAPV